MSDVKNLPILFLGFRRFDSLVKCLHQVLKSRPSHIYLALDGPVNHEDQKVQDEIIREFSLACKKFDTPISILQRDCNLGLSVAIISALDWFFANENSGVVLEDDLIVSEDFIPFCKYGLEKFADDTEVWIISGNQYFSEAKMNSQISWSNYPLIWGWATWRARWLEIRSNIIRNQQQNFRHGPLSVRAFLWLGSYRSRLGLVDSWAIPLCVAMRINFKYSLLPPNNLVKNIGFDSYATHTDRLTSQLNSEALLIDSYLDVDILNRSKDAKAINRLVEKYIYGVSFLNCLSFVLHYTKSFFSMTKQNTPKSMEKRLATAESHALYS